MDCIIGHMITIIHWQTLKQESSYRVESGKHSSIDFYYYQMELLKKKIAIKSNKNIDIIYKKLHKGNLKILVNT